MKIRPNRFTMLLGSLLLSLAACNHDEANNSSDTATIKVMFIGQITDTANATSLPEAAAGVSAAIASINKSGGLFGTAFELFICDDKADANEAAKCARKAVRKKVIATLGNTSNFGNIILPILEQAGIASIGNNPISPRDFSSSVAFPLQGGSPVAISGASRLLIDQGARRIRLATVDSPAGAISEDFAKLGFKNSEAKLLGTTLIPAGAPDYASYANTLIADSDGIVISTNADQAARIIVALRQAGATQAISLPAVALPPATLKQLGDAANGLLIAANFRPATSQSKTSQQFMHDMQTYADNAKLNVFSMQSWLAAQTLYKVIMNDGQYAQASDLSANSILASMNNLNELLIGDITPPLSTTTALAEPYSRLFINQVLYGQVQKGVIELIDEQWHNTLN